MKNIIKKIKKALVSRKLKQNKKKLFKKILEIHYGF